MAPAYPRLLTNAENPLPAPEWWERSDEGEVQFAYWVPNVSGGLVITTLPMQTGWDLESNLRYAKVAEENGFAAALSQTRWFASYGADHQHEAFVISSHIRVSGTRGWWRRCRRLLTWSAGAGRRSTS
jgi:FMNH2-dependent dimethyl sulfone monooxygenase